MAKRKIKFTPLDPKKHGIGGLVRGGLRPKKQDYRFQAETFYAVVFFPKIQGLGKARVYKQGIAETLSHTKEAAIARFDDVHPSVRDKRSWKQSHAAGQMVRRIKIIDLGPA